MRRSLLCVFFTMIFGGTAIAQEAKEKIHGGIKAGLNIANVRRNIDGVAGHERPLLGINAGLYAVIPMSDRLFIQPEILYSKAGAIFFNEKLSFSYLNVPLLFKFKPKKSSFGFCAGPQAGILMSAKEKRNIGGAEKDVKDEFAKTNFSAIVGIDANISKVDLSLRYDFGLSNISKTDDFTSLKLRAISFSIGYRFF